MAITFDGINKLIILDSSITVSLRTDVYTNWVDWVATADNMKYLPAMTVVADPPTIPLYVTLVNGWKIQPFAGFYTVTIGDGYLYTSDSSDPFVASGGTEPRIIYREPVAAIGYASGSGVLPADITAIAAATKVRMEEAGSKLTKVDTITKLIPAAL